MSKLPKSIGLASVFAVAPSLALGCSLNPEWPGAVRMDGAKVAAAMVEAATHVDLAKVETTDNKFKVFTNTEASMLAAATTDSEKDNIRSMFASERTDYEDVGLRLNFRVVEHLKGDGGDTFTLNGMRPPLPEINRPKKFVWEAPLSQLPAFLYPLDLADFQSSGDCGLPLFGETGMVFLVFRTEEGGLLYERVPVTYKAENTTAVGPSYVPINSNKDAWLLLVREAVLEEQKRRKKVVSAAVGAVALLLGVAFLGGRLRARRR